MFRFNDLKFSYRIQIYNFFSKFQSIFSKYLLFTNTNNQVAEVFGYSIK